MNIQKTQLKKPAVFPVERTVVDHGLDKKRVLNHGDIVTCWWCGERIRLHSKNTFTVPGDPSEMVYIECKECGKRTSIQYEFDRVVRRSGKTT